MSERIEGTKGEAVATSCSWCHAMNSVSEQACSGCGHDAQRPRLECGCERGGPREVDAMKRAYKLRRCVGFGEKTGQCQEQAGPNPYWCPACEVERRAHLSRRFKELEAEMEKAKARAAEERV